MSRLGPARLWAIVVAQSLWAALTWFCRPFNDSFRIIELLAILIAITAFILELGNRQEEREARAWQLVTTKAVGNSGKNGALEYLNSEQHWPFFPKWWPLHKERVELRRVDLTSYSPAEKKQIIEAGICQRRTVLKNVQLPDAQLVLTTFFCAELPQANFQNAKLGYADLRGTNLREANLRNADLRGAMLQGADLTGAYLIGADLSDADLRDTWLTHVDLKEADLQRADIRDAKLITCEQLKRAKNWERAFRNKRLECEASRPDPLIKTGAPQLIPKTLTE